MEGRPAPSRGVACRSKAKNPAKKRRPQGRLFVSVGLVSARDALSNPRRIPESATVAVEIARQIALYMVPAVTDRTLGFIPAEF